MIIKDLIMVAFFTIAKKGKQPKCLSPSKWINKIWYSHTMEYHLSVKKNELLTHAITWVTTKPLLYSVEKKSQPQKNTLYYSMYIKCPKKANRLALSRVGNGNGKWL